MKKKQKTETLSIELGKLGAKVHEALEAAAQGALVSKVYIFSLKGIPG